jgi:hypothetical protein
LEPAALDQLFRMARTVNEWSETPVDERVVRELYDRASTRTDLTASPPADRFH